MELAHQELARMSRQCDVLLLEVVLAAFAALALFFVSGRMDGTLPEAQVAFFACLAIFAIAWLQLLPRAIRQFSARCPQCARPFHVSGAPARITLRLRSCAHCGFSNSRGPEEAT